MTSFRLTVNMLCVWGLRNVKPKNKNNKEKSNNGFTSQEMTRKESTLFYPARGKGLSSSVSGPFSNRRSAPFHSHILIAVPSGEALT